MNETKAGTLAILRDLTSQIGKSLLMAVPPVRRWRLKAPRTSLHLNDIDAYLKESAYFGLDLLLEHAGDIRGKSVCEIGPGDFLSSGLSMLAAGAKKYTVIDRFPGNYRSETAKAMYKQIAANWSRFYPEIVWDARLAPEVFPEKYGDRLDLISDPIETAAPSEKFDILCSFQVAEHVSDIRVFASAHNNLLKPNGVGVHRVDFGPHDVWAEYRDPATFLRFPELVWKMSGANRGIPNRRRHSEFIDAFAKAGLNAEVLYLDHFDEQFVDFAKLNKQFRAMQKDSVLVKTAVYRLKRNDSDAVDRSGSANGQP